MLSAQCKDERVNKVTEKLFAIAPDAPSMAALDEEQIAEIIKPCGLHGAKSRNLKGAAQMIVDRFNGVVPHTMEELVQLPGIGRKSLLFITALFTITRTWNQPRCISTDEWIKKLWYMYTREYYSGIKGNAF